jgi:N-acetylmuramoyl-L-alanine amidase
LAYGLGEDRLGGSKMGYVDSGVLLRVIDTAKNMYKVQLSKYHSAYLSKNDIQFNDTFQPKKHYLLNSWSVRGTDKDFDMISLSMEERLPYKSWMEISPSKIMLDVYGVQANSNWITQLTSLKEIKNVYFNQVEDDVVRITIELKHETHWGYAINYRNNSLTIRVNHPPDYRVKGLTIAIDAGHGGTNTGAKGLTTNILEKDYTIRFAKALQKYLKCRKAKVIMTRDTDTTIDNKDRVLFLQQHQPDILISIHLNSAGNKSVKGVSTYYKHIGFRPLTTTILDRMLDLKLNEFGNVGNFNFLPNAPTDFPSCLVEVAFLSNEEDEKRILSSRFHKDVAKKIYKGIKDFLKQAD